MNDFQVGIVERSNETLKQLCELLIETVAQGGSVSFMDPLSLEDANAFWARSFAAAARGDRVIFGAWQGEQLLGTVTLLLDCPPNQPHRAEVAKMMTRIKARGRGVATSLIGALEVEAVRRGRTLLVLDTASDGGAAVLYERLGFRFAGEIPDYALKPHGGLTGTKIYWKRIGDAAPPEKEFI
jgi:ribosomal protein S18 acetylase RimI-like enzyme